jgi:hypothetical protein
MTVKELIAKLQALPGDAQKATIHCASDEEGNQYNTLVCVDWDPENFPGVVTFIV